jgi:hypothetical protein
MKLFKALLVIATVCFIFFVAAGYNLPVKGESKVLYDKNDCNSKLLIEEKGRSICIRSKEVVEFHPGPVAKIFVE